MLDATAYFLEVVCWRCQHWMQGLFCSFDMAEPFSRGGDVVCQWRWLCLLEVSTLLEVAVLFVGGNSVGLGRC